MFLPLTCNFLIHQCHLPISFRRVQPSPSLSLITPSEQPIMRFLIWQPGCIIYAEPIRHKTHGCISWGILLFNTSKRLSLFKHHMLHLFLSFLCSINVLENGKNNWKADNMFGFEHSKYSEGSMNIIKCYGFMSKFLASFLLRIKNWKTITLAGVAQWIEPRPVGWCSPVDWARAQWIKGWPVWLPVKAHARVSDQATNGGHARGNYTLMFLFVSFSFPSL